MIKIAVHVRDLKRGSTSGIGQINREIYHDHRKDQQHHHAFHHDQIACEMAWNTSRPRPGR